MSSNQHLPTFAPCGPDGRRPERIDEVLTALAAYWHQYPDYRLGQIIDNFARSLAAQPELDVDRQSGWRLSPLLPASLSFSHGDGAAIVVIQVAEVGNGTVVPVIGAVP